MKYYDVPPEVIYRAYDGYWEYVKVTTFSENVFYRFNQWVGENQYPLNKDFVIKYCTEIFSLRKGTKCTFEDFVEANKKRLCNYEKDSVEFYIDCFFTSRDLLKPWQRVEITTYKSDDNIINNKLKVIKVSEYITTRNDIYGQTTEYLEINGLLYEIPSKQVMIASCQEWAFYNLNENASFDDFCEHFKEELSRYWNPDMSYSQRNNWRFYTACYILTLDKKFQPRLNVQKEEAVDTRSIDALLGNNCFGCTKTYDEKIEECKSYLAFYFLWIFTYPMLGLLLYLFKDIIHFILFYIGSMVSLTIELSGDLFKDLCGDNIFDGLADWTQSSLNFDSTAAWKVCMVIIAILYLIAYTLIIISEWKRVKIALKAIFAKEKLNNEPE